jgi:hypothetical protein
VNFMRLLGLMYRLAAILGVMEGVKAKDPATTAESYRPAADVLLTSGSGAAFLAKLSVEQKAQLTAALPLAIWAIDSFTE